MDNPTAVRLQAQDEALRAWVAEEVTHQPSTDATVDAYEATNRRAAIQDLVVAAVARGEHPDRAAVAFALKADTLNPVLIEYVRQFYVLASKPFTPGPRRRRSFWGDIQAIEIYQTSRQHRASHQRAMLEVADRIGISTRTMERILRDHGNPSS